MNTVECIATIFGSFRASIQAWEFLEDPWGAGRDVCPFHQCRWGRRAIPCPHDAIIHDREFQATGIGIGRRKDSEHFHLDHKRYKNQWVYWMFIVFWPIDITPAGERQMFVTSHIKLFWLNFLLRSSNLPLLTIQQFHQHPPKTCVSLLITTDPMGTWSNHSPCSVRKATQATQATRFNDLTAISP